MPDRVYLPKDPSNPTILERVEAHICEVFLSASTVVVGTLIILGAFFENFDPSPSLAQLNDIVGFLVGFVMFVGGSLWLKAIITTYEYADQAWFRIRIGTASFGFGWLVYALTSCFLRPHSVVPWFIGFTLSSIGFAHYVVSLKIQARIVNAHNKNKKSGAGNDE